MWSPVNVLPNSPKIPDMTNRDVFQVNMASINGSLGWKCSYGDFSSVYYPWTSWLWKGVQKQQVSGIQVTTFFGLSNFQNI